MRRVPFVACAVVGGLALGGCESLFDKPETMLCPSVAVPRDLSELVAFAGDGRDLIDVDYAGRIADVNSECRFLFDDDARTGGTLEVTVRPRFEAERGNADTDRAGALPYFVAVTTADREPRQKQQFTVLARFPGNVTRMRVDDTPVRLRVPLRDGQRGTDFEIYVGFQLTPEQLAFNRRRFSRR